MLTLITILLQSECIILSMLWCTSSYQTLLLSSWFPKECFLITAFLNVPYEEEELRIYDSTKSHVFWIFFIVWSRESFAAYKISKDCCIIFKNDFWSWFY